MQLFACLGTSLESGSLVDIILIVSRPACHHGGFPANF